MKKNIFAFTKCGNDRPDFISVNTISDDDSLELSVRSDSGKNYSTITLTWDEIVELKNALQSYIDAEIK